MIDSHSDSRMNRQREKSVNILNSPDALARFGTKICGDLAHRDAITDEIDGEHYEIEADDAHRLSSSFPNCADNFAVPRRHEKISVTSVILDFRFLPAQRLRWRRGRWH